MQLEEVPEILNPICPKMTTNGNCGMFVIEFIDLIFDVSFSQSKAFKYVLFKYCFVAYDYGRP